MCIVVKESYMWVYGGILNYSDLVGQFLQECREVQALETLAIYISKDLGKQKNHMGSCGWARAEENQSMGQNVLLVPRVAQIPLLFWGRFWVSSLLPWTLNLLWACSFLFFSAPEPTFYSRLPSSTLRFAPWLCSWWIFKWSLRNRILCLWSGCPYPQGELDSEVLGAAPAPKNLH